jgi:hypothetical protein
MTDLREAFCKMLEAYHGPDADEYTRWARSGDPGDTERLTGYVRSTISAIQSFGGANERAHLPMLRALLTELTSGERAERGEWPAPATSSSSDLIGEARRMAQKFDEWKANRIAPAGVAPESAPADQWAKARKEQVFCGLFLRCLTSLDVTTAEARAEAAVEALEARGLVEAMYTIMTRPDI